MNAPGTSTPTAPDRFATDPHPGEPGAVAVWDGIKRVLRPLASLRLTVVLLGLATFLVLAGTLAQADYGIETVVRDYFRARPWEAPRFGFTWMPFQIFLPASFFPNALAESRPTVPGGFWYPGGWLLGLVMFANLLAAHLVRFTFQTRGTRLWGGVAAIASGIALTALVVSGGDLAGGGGEADYGPLWHIFQVGVVMAGLANLATVVWLHVHPGNSRKLAWLATLAAPATVGLAVWAVLVGDISGSSMRILWQLIKGTMAAGVLFGGCWLVFKQRAGIVLLHSGIALLMVSELLVGLQAVETQMLLGEGETKGWAQDIRSVELVVIDPTDAKSDTITAVPKSRVTKGATVSHPSFPFTVRIDDYFPNATLIDPPADDNRATVGSGNGFVAREVPEVAGTDTKGGTDTPAAYATVFGPDGQPLGKYLLSAALGSIDVTEPVMVDGKEWRLALRFVRDYKPYAVTLADVRKDDYVGTDTVRNYSSDVRITPAAGGEGFETRIWMNNPLRYAGETLYQSGYQRDGTGREYTTLQIVRNSGWMLPYVSCMIVAVGMLGQFLVTLLRFLGRRADAARPTIAAESGTGEPPLRGAFWVWAFPTAVTAVFGLYLASKAMPPRPLPGRPDLAAFGTLPVASQGRVKPIDTVARDALKALSDNRQTFKDSEGNAQPAIRWLIDMIAEPDKGGEWRVVRIDNEELLAELELPKDRDGFVYSVNELIPKIETIAGRADAARAKKRASTPLTAADRKALELERKFGVLDTLLRSFRPSVQELMAGGPGPEGFRRYFDRYRVFKFGDMAAEIPSRNPPLSVYYKGEWETLGHAELMETVDAIRAQSEKSAYEPAPGVLAWANILSAYKKNDTGDFDRGVARYRRELAAEPPPGYSPGKTRFESYFNHSAPFYYAIIPYTVAALLAAVGWLGWNRPLNRAASWLILLAFAAHTVALVGRIYISGRPPVTNLYSSAVFIGWAAVAFGIGLERLFRLGFGNVLAGTAGFATLLIAHNLSGDGDTFAVLQAVLDTQFWLATHVVCITLGYAATYVAGVLGLLYVVLGVATPLLARRTGHGVKTQTLGQSLARMCYGVLCFAILFSFVGTVLGGLWADDSWGRFWGWDPKENGALIIVLWNALVLHASWGGLVKDRGLAVLAVLGNVAVSWSWFGTNELGVGLHSYGFTEGVLLALGLFVLSQLAIAGAGCLPKSAWRSFRAA